MHSSNCDDTTSSSDNNNNSVIIDMLPTDVSDRVQVMRMQEETTYRCTDYFFHQSKNDDDDGDGDEDPVVDADCRTKMCEWNYEVVDVCKFRRETVDMAMSYLDRFLSCCTANNNNNNNKHASETLQCKRQFQLASMTTLYMAVKLFEPLEMDTHLLSELSRGVYSAAEIAEMEQVILNALEWRVNGPTRLSLAQHFLALLPKEVRHNVTLAESLLAVTRFSTEVAAMDYYFTTTRPSVTALACVLNAMSVVGGEEFIKNGQMQAFLQSLTTYGGMNPFSSEVAEARRRLLRHADWEGLAQVIPANNNQMETTTTTKEDEINNSNSNNNKTATTAEQRNGEDEMQQSPVCVSRAPEEQ